MKSGTLGRADYLFLAAGWLALLLGCIVHSRGTPMWVDELYSFNLIQDPSLSHMLAASGDQSDGAPPLYYFFIRPWAAAFSMSELSLRLFSSVAICAAFALVWNALRRAFAFWPAAVSLGLVFGTSHVIRFENANVRFYGLLLALISLATLLAVKLGEREQPGRPLLAANTLAQAVLVLCHPLGGCYSAALLGAVSIGDVILLRRWRWRIALTYPLGWMALLLWFQQLLRQADLNNPHSWVPVPGFQDIALVLYGGSDFYPLFPLLVLLTAGAVITINHPRMEMGTAVADEPPLSASATASGGLLIPAGTCRQLIIAVAFISLPLVLWVFSRLVPSNPLFLARYVIGVSIGWAIMLAFVTGAILRCFGPQPKLWMKLAMTAFIVLNLGPLITEPGPDNGGLTGESDTAFGHEDLPIVCQRSHDFLPRTHYSPQADRYYYLLDWDAACAPGNSRHATVEFKILDSLRRNYPGLFHDHIVDAKAFLAAHPIFLIHAVPQLLWMDLRLQPAEYTITRVEPDRELNYARDGVWPLLLVERKPKPAS